MSEEKTGRAIELPNYFSVLPAFKGIYEDIKYDYQDASMHHPKTAYVFKVSPLSVNEIRKFLKNIRSWIHLMLGSKYRFWPRDKDKVGLT